VRRTFAKGKARQPPLRCHGAGLMPLSKLVAKPCIKLTGIRAGAKQWLLSNRRRLAQSLSFGVGKRQERIGSVAAFAARCEAIWGSVECKLLL